MTVLTAHDTGFQSYAISENMGMSDEGFLHCYDVPIARTGVQWYIGQEIGQPQLRDKRVKVYRLAVDVFNEAAMRSAEGKPVTDEHPPKGISPGNYTNYARGHMQNLRKEGEYLVAELVINDASLIEKIKNGKREVSLGYTPKYEPYLDGFKQTVVTINHAAIVDKGRAGPEVAIKDDANLINQSKRSHLFMNTAKAKAVAIALFAKDHSENELADFIHALDGEPDYSTEKVVEGVSIKKMAEGIKDAVKDAMRGKDKKAKDEGEEEEIEKKEKMEDKKAKDEEEEKAKDTLSALTLAVANLTQIVTDMKGKDDYEGSEEKEDERELKEILKGKQEDKKAKDKRGKDSDEEEEKKEGEAPDAHAKDSMLEVAKILRPVIAELSAKDQDLVKDALLKGMRGSGKTGRYAGTASVRENQKGSFTQTDRTTADGSELGMNWAKKFNPHYKESKKA